MTSPPAQITFQPVTGERWADLVSLFGPRGKRLPPVSSFMGIPDVLERAGFKRVAQPSEAKLVMRYTIGDAVERA